MKNLIPSSVRNSQLRDALSCLYPGPNCVFCVTKETGCSIACDSYIPLNKNLDRYHGINYTCVASRWRTYKTMRCMHDSRSLTVRV